MTNETNLSEAKRELENALDALCTNVNDDCNNNANGFRRGNSYERKRGLRRIDRALTNLELSIERNDEEDCSEKASSVEETNDCCPLDASTMDCLLDVLTELPRILILDLPQDPQGNAPNSNNNMADNTSLYMTNSDDIQPLYNQSVSTTCQILKRYADLPLKKVQMDKILDRVAHMAVRKNIQYDIIHVLNSSLLAMDCQHELQNESSGLYGDEHFNSNPSNKTNNHFRETSPFLLNADETLTLTNLFVQLSVKHLNIPWSSNHINPRKNHDKNNDDNDEDSKYQDQENEVQLRILLSYLFRHMVMLSSQENTHGDYCNLSTEKRLQIMFEQSCLDEYQANNTTRTMEDIRMIAAQTSREMQQDYMDLVSSFCIEVIDYALEVIRKSDHHLETHMLSKEDQLSLSSQQPNFSSTSGGGGNDTVVEDLIRQVFRHTSLAVNFIELLHDDLQMPISSSRHHVYRLWSAYADFVASFCQEEMLYNCTSTLDEVGCTKVLLSSIDDILFRLFQIIDRKCLDQGFSNDTSLLYHGQKRKRDVEGQMSWQNIENVGSAKIITMLRAFTKMRNGEKEERDADSPYGGQLLSSLLAASISGQYFHPRNDRSYKESSARGRHGLKIAIEEGVDSTIMRQRADEGVSTIVQALAMTSILLPNDDLGMESKVNEQMVASLIKPLTHSHTKDGNEDQTGQPLLDSEALNPWNSILKRKLSDALSYSQASNMGAVVSDTLPGVVTTSTMSSISDLSSHNNTAKRSAPKSASDDQSALVSYMKDVNQCIRTII